MSLWKCPVLIWPILCFVFYLYYLRWNFTHKSLCESDYSERVAVEWMIFSCAKKDQIVGPLKTRILDGPPMTKILGLLYLGSRVSANSHISSIGCALRNTWNSGEITSLHTSKLEENIGLKQHFGLMHKVWYMQKVVISDIYPHKAEQAESFIRIRFPDLLTILDSDSLIV